MPSERFGEWLLSLVTSRERAASMVGDLLEEGRTRGTGWFLAAVVRTACSMMWRDVARSPVRMAGLAIVGFVLQFVLMAVSIALFAIGVGVAAFVAFKVGLFDPQHPPSWVVMTPSSIPVGPMGVAATIVGLAAFLASQFQVGRVLARRSPGSELAPCVAMTLLGALVGFGLDVVLSGALSAVFDLGYQALWLPLQLPLFAGAVRVRNRRAAT